MFMNQTTQFKILNASQIIYRFKITQIRAGKMAQRLRAHAAIAKDLCSVPITYLLLQIQGVQHPFLSQGHCTRVLTLTEVDTHAHN